MHQSTIISCFSVEEFSRVHTIEDFLVFLNKSSVALWGTTVKPFDASQLIALGDRNNSNRYQSFQIKKKTHGFRTIHAPCEELKRIQKILSLVLTSFHHKNEVSFGFEIGKSIVDNARVHVKQEYILNIDVKDFFFSFNDQMVLKGLKKVGFITSKQSTELIELLIQLLTENLNELNNLTPVLPQGSPASPIITNILCEELDNDLQVLANMYACKYSRYADDISFSSQTNLFKKKERFYQEVIKTIQSKYGLLVNEKKYRVLSKKYRQVVTGIVVNEELNVRRVFLKEIRMWLYYWERYGYRYANLLFLNKYAKDDLISKALKSFLMGRINYIKQVKGFDSSTYLKYLSRIDQLIKREYKPIFKYAITLIHLDTTILNEAEYARAQNLLSKIDIAYVKANIFLKLQDFKKGTEYVVSRKNPFVFEYLGFNKKNLKAVLYINTPEGPIKIGAVPDIRRFAVNGEAFNVDNYAHVTAINPAFTQLEGNTYILTGPGKDFRDLYKKMEAAYLVLDKFADQFSEGNPVTVDNKTLNEIFDFNQAFNFTQNYTREKLSDLGDYADFEILVSGGVVNGERVDKTVQGKIVRISSSTGVDYKVITSEGVYDLGTRNEKLIEELESIVSESFESGYMTFYKDIKEINNPNMPGRTIVKNSYKAVGLDLPTYKDAPELQKSFINRFVEVAKQFECARQELEQRSKNSEDEFYTIRYRIREAVKRLDKEELKKLNKSLLNEKGDFLKYKVDKLSKEWFFAFGRKYNSIDYKIAEVPSFTIKGFGESVCFQLTLKSFFNERHYTQRFKVKQGASEKDNLVLSYTVKEIGDNYLILESETSVGQTAKITKEQNLIDLINLDLEHYVLKGDNSVILDLPRLYSIHYVKKFGRKDVEHFGDLIPVFVKNVWNISFVAPEPIIRVDYKDNKRNRYPIVTNPYLTKKSTLTKAEFEFYEFSNLSYGPTISSSQFEPKNESEAWVFKRLKDKLLKNEEADESMILKSWFYENRDLDIPFNGKALEIESLRRKNDKIIPGILYINSRLKELIQLRFSLFGYSHISTLALSYEAEMDYLLEEKKLVIKGWEAFHASYDELYYDAFKERKITSLDAINTLNAISRNNGWVFRKIMDKRFYNTLIPFDVSVSDLRNTIDKLEGLYSNTDTSNSERNMKDIQFLENELLKWGFAKEEFISVQDFKEKYLTVNVQDESELQAFAESKKYLEDSKVASFIKSIKAYKERLNKEGRLPEGSQESLDYQLDRLKGLGYTDEEIQKMVDDYIEPELPTFSYEELDPATQISIDIARANLREILPANVSIQDIQNVLSKLKANGVPMGAVWNKVLYLNKAINPGTEYHEAFHFVFKYFLNNAQRNALLKSAQVKYGKPTAEQLKKIENETDLRKGFSEKELTNIYYEELLADGLSQYKMSSESSQVYGVIELFYFNIVAGLYKIRRAWN